MPSRGILGDPTTRARPPSSRVGFVLEFSRGNAGHSLAVAGATDPSGGGTETGHGRDQDWRARGRGGGRTAGPPATTRLASRSFDGTRFTGSSDGNYRRPEVPAGAEVRTLELIR